MAEHGQARKSQNRGPRKSVVPVGFEGVGRVEEIRRKKWPVGLPFHQDYPVAPLHSLLENSAGRYPDRPGLIFGGIAYTYGQLWELAEKLATGLSGLGVQKGDVVAIHLPNTPQFFLAYQALLRLGAIFNPCNPALTQRELVYQLNDCGATTIVTMDRFYPAVRQVREQTRLGQVVVTSEAEFSVSAEPVPTAGLGEGVYSLLDLARQASPNPPPVVFDPRHDAAHIAYTGGTTGLAKGVVVSHYNVMANTIQALLWSTGGRVTFEEGRIGFTGFHVDRPGDHWEFPLRMGEEITLAVAPWFHAMGTVGYVDRCVAMGATVVVQPRFDLQAYLADVAEFQPTFLGGAPPLFVALLAAENLSGINFSSVRQIASSAAPLAVELLKRLRDNFPEAVVMEGYGLTEATMGVAFNPAGWRAARKTGTVGLPFFDTEVRIMDLDEGRKELPPGQDGEICVRGPQVMAGYHNRPEATAEVLTDGWLHTGDIGRLDEDGYLTVVDRKKDMLIYKGYNVYPRELEEILFQHPAVANCTVIGKPVAAVGEIPKAFVVLARGREAAAKELMDFVAEQVAPYKRLRELQFVPEIPVNPAGKVLKRLLREQETG